MNVLVVVMVTKKQRERRKIKGVRKRKIEKINWGKF